MTPRYACDHEAGINSPGASGHGRIRGLKTNEKRRRLDA